MNKQIIIDEIMDFLDFEKIHRVMEALNWGWVDTEGEVPEVWEIRQFLRKLLNKFIDSNLDLLESGGFVITKIETEDGEAIKVIFNVESWETESVLD